MYTLKEGLFAAGICLSIVLCAPSYVNGLSCYECSSSDGNLCTDSLNRKVIQRTDCNTSLFTQANFNNEEFICISTKEQNSTHTLHTRRCGLKSEASICDTITNDFTGYSLAKCVTCQEDLCNSSVNIRTDLFIFHLVIIVNCFKLIKTYL